MLKYLNVTKSSGLESFYLPFEKAKLRNSQHLPCGRRWEQIAYADASCAPPHEKHRSVHSVILEHAGNILMWETTRQPFIAQSTAQSEVLGYNEAYQATESMAYRSSRRNQWRSCCLATTKQRSHCVARTQALGGLVTSGFGQQNHVRRWLRVLIGELFIWRVETW